VESFDGITLVPGGVGLATCELRRTDLGKSIIKEKRSFETTCTRIIGSEARQLNLLQGALLQKYVPYCVLPQEQTPKEAKDLPQFFHS
jgi:hypothetical protein